MKKFIKNNLKVFVAVVISGIVFGGIGVYAANTYLAHDISYTPSNENFDANNVEDALNELYDNSEIAKSINIKLQNETRDSLNFSHAAFLINDANLDINKHYKHFKLENQIKNENVSYCKVTAWSRKYNNSVELEYNKQYDVLNSDDEYTFSAIYLVTLSKKAGDWANCSTNILFYN